MRHRTEFQNLSMKIKETKFLESGLLRLVLRFHRVLYLGPTLKIVTIRYIYSHRIKPIPILFLKTVIKIFFFKTISKLPYQNQSLIRLCNFPFICRNVNNNVFACSLKRIFIQISLCWKCFSFFFQKNSCFLYNIF